MLKIFVNTWGNYNENGADGGQWITLPMDSDELEETLDNIAAAMGDHDPEWAIHDYEWDCDIDFESVSEMDSISAWNELCEELESLEEYEREEIAAAIEAFGYSIQDAINYQQRGNFIFYAGQTLQDVAEEIADEYLDCKDVPDFIRNYFDYDAFARDLSCDGYTETEWGVILDC